MDGPLALAEKTPKIEKARPTEEGRAISKRMEGGRCDHHWNPMARGACWFRGSLGSSLSEHVRACRSLSGFLPQLLDELVELRVDRLNCGGVVCHRLADVFDVVVVVEPNPATRRVVCARYLLVDGRQ